jgi:hypothetical protein
VTNAVLSENMVCVGLFDNGVYMHISLFNFFLVVSDKMLLLQGQRRSFEVGKDGGPTLFTKSFDCGALG